MGGVVAGNSDIFVHLPNTSSHSSISAGKCKFSALTQDDISLSEPASRSSSAFTSFSAMPSKTSSKGGTRATSSKVTSAIALSGVQGSINRLTDAVEKSNAEGSAKHREVVKHLQRTDDGLTTTEKLDLLSKFEDNEVYADTYIALEDEDLRRAWINRRLGSGFGGAAAGASM
jgi:hypothetical protein